MFPDLKGRGSRGQGCSNIAINPGFLVGVDANCFCQHHIFNTVPEETHDSVRVNLDVVIRSSSEHLPVNVFKNSLAVESPIGPTSFEASRGWVLSRTDDWSDLPNARRGRDL